MSTKVIKKLIIALFICCVIWGVIRQQSHKINTVKIDDKEIKSTVMPGKKFIPNESKQPKEAASVEVDHSIIQTNPVISPVSSINFTQNNRKLTPVTADEDNSNNTQKKMLLSPEAVWNGRRLIITTTAAFHNDVNNIKENKNESKQQRPSENQGNTPVEPDKVRCPLVEKIQKTAQQINDSFLYEGTYRIVSYEPVFQDSDMSWLVGVRGIIAGSSDEAIYMAGIAISETNHHINEYAEMLDGQAFSLPAGVFACYYGSGDIIALGIRDKMPIEE